MSEVEDSRVVLSVASVGVAETSEDESRDEGRTKETSMVVCGVLALDWTAVVEASSTVLLDGVLDARAEILERKDVSMVV